MPILDFLSENEPKFRKSGKEILSGPSICEVCAGKATGHHYNVATCNGCKSFFRRVTIENLKYKCQSNGQCANRINASIKKCRACRYEKCLKIGMNKLGILSEFKKHKLRDEYACDTISPPLETVESQISDLIEYLVELDIKSKKFRDCAFFPKVAPNLISCIENESSLMSIAEKVGPMKGWPISQEEYTKHQKMMEIQGSSCITPNIKRWLTFDLLVMIELAKAFHFYRQLDKKDRYTLLRSTTLMAANLSKSYFSHENKFSCLMRPDGIMYSLPLHLEIAPNKKELLNDVRQKCLYSLIQLNISHIEFLLLRAILFCNSNIDDLSAEGREVLIKERHIYTASLLQYLLLNYGINGPGRFANILNVIDVLERQQKDQRDMTLLMRLGRPRTRIPLHDDIMLID